MADQVKPAVLSPSTRFIHSQDRGVTMSAFGKMYYRNGWTCAFVEVDNTKILIGISVCGGNDAFNKKIGRDIAEGRMKKRPIILYKTENESAFHVAKEFAEESYFEENEGMDPVGDNEVVKFEMEPA